MSPVLLIGLPVLILAVVVHEAAHGWMAERYGDDTARAMGRITLNPLAHIDLVGTILLPALLILTQAGMLFGWAKPVPVDVTRLRNPRVDAVKVSLAGPASNLLLAVMFATPIWALWLIHQDVTAFIAAAVRVLSMGALVNIVLAVFNMIPIPPLDGSRILTLVLPARAAMAVERLGGSVGFMLVLGLSAFGILNKILNPAVGLIYRLLFTGIGGDYAVLLYL